MQVTPLIRHLREQCPLFEQRVSGGIDWDSLEGSAKLPAPAAYVVMTDEDAKPSQTQNVISQLVTESFDVCVLFEQKPGDERGQLVGDQVDAVRKQLCRALVGYRPEPDYDPIEYSGRELLLNTRAKAVYRFSFVTEFQLGRNNESQPAETWHERVLDGLPPFEGVHMNFDFIDPMVDKNLSEHGPDGRIEFQAREDLPQ
jgi:hypothetical protein